MNRARATKANGFTLVEVLVTVFVLAVGILGVAGMQAVSVRESGNIFHRTQSDLLLASIIDRMRANRDEARLGAGSVYSTTAAKDAVATDCSASTCDAEALAMHDLNEWQQAMTRSNLPAGVLTINHDADVMSDTTTVGSVYTIRVFWDEDRDGDTGQGCDPDNDADMACASITVQI
ncbi:MAG: type IV pilus modification protein PilV [Gammaproteobacteria bacterium]|nr:type IV pilus modification protein PilV [Gammaproteobacteria bacterium]NND39403.1 type IV pilus modification protein PilV [Pseudomonadales bacterium]NNM10606.1 type IV pilus modification protein PilV [Pseudomonadales bacterium]